MEPDPLTLRSLKDWSEIVKNFAAALGLIGAVFALFKWLATRRDRSTEVLFELEDRFHDQAMNAGKSLLEDDEVYEGIRLALLEEALPADELDRSEERDEGPQTDMAESLASLDALLRFFVLLLGVRKARQVSEPSLRACYRYWLAQSFSPCRRELRIYIEKLFPTLHRWLVTDAKWWRRWLRTSFFRSTDFGWRLPGRPDRERLRWAARGKVLVITGAGISADSKIRTYRGSGGLWRSYHPETLATRKAFGRRPAMIWEWYRERREEVRRAGPSPGHLLLVDFARRAREFLLVTQNVDNLHERAGTSAEQLVHIHGEIMRTRCSSDACGYDDWLEYASEGVPGCPRCGSPLRPGVIWFDEECEQREKDRIESFLAAGPCDLVVVIGTTARFVYIVDWALRGVGKAGFLVEINPESTNLTVAADWHLRKKAKAGLAVLRQAIDHKSDDVETSAAAVASAAKVGG